MLAKQKIANLVHQNLLHQAIHRRNYTTPTYTTRNNGYRFFGCKFCIESRQELKISRQLFQPSRFLKFRGNFIPSGIVFRGFGEHLCLNSTLKNLSPLIKITNSQKKLL